MIDWIAVRDEVAAVGIVDAESRGILLVGVARHEATDRTEAHVDEPRAVDSCRGHPAPFVRRAEEAPSSLDRLRRTRLEPVGVAIAAERVGVQPARIVVGGAHPRPAGAALLERERLAGED